MPRCASRSPTRARRRPRTAAANVFHRGVRRETPPRTPRSSDASVAPSSGAQACRSEWHTRGRMSGPNLSAFDEGVIVGLLLGEGHFGGDGRKPQVTLRMHVRHEALLRWLQARLPRSRLYGPYHHGDRHYFQWMARGPALVEDLLPILDRHIEPELDGHAYARL